MTRFLFKLLPITAMFVTCGSAYAVTCTIGVTPLTTIAFNPTTALQLTGTVSGACTPAAGSDIVTPPNIYIGVSSGGRAPRSMALSGTQLITYQINKSAGAGIWNEAIGTPTLTADGGLLFVMAALSVKNTAQAYSYTFYLNIPAQPAAQVGTYNDPTITATINKHSATGAPLGTATFGLTATIANNCRFSTNPASLNINYTSFSAAAATGTSSFSLNCNNGTRYSQALTPATGTAQGINYSLALSATTGLIGSALNQTYTTTGTAAAGQAGICASGPCVSTANAHTVTVTF